MRAGSGDGEAGGAGYFTVATAPAGCAGDAARAVPPALRDSAGSSAQLRIAGLENPVLNPYVTGENQKSARFSEVARRKFHAHALALSLHSPANTEVIAPALPSSALRCSLVLCLSVPRSQSVCTSKQDAVTLSMGTGRRV